MRCLSCIGTVPTDPQPVIQPAITSAPAVPAVPQLPTPDALAAVAQLFQSPHGQEVSSKLVYVCSSNCVNTVQLCQWIAGVLLKP